MAKAFPSLVFSSSLLLLLVLRVDGAAQIVFPDENYRPQNFGGVSGGVHPQGPPSSGGFLASQGGPPLQIGPPIQGGAPGFHGDAPVQSNPNLPVETKIGGDISSAGGEVLFFPKSVIQPKVPCITAAGVTGECRLLVQCATFFAEIAALSRSPCEISHVQQGVCCHVVQYPTLDTNSIVVSPAPSIVATPHLEQRQINFAVEQSVAQSKQREIKERALVFNNIMAEPGSPVFLHARLFNPSDSVVEKGRNATLALGATLNIIKEFGLTKEQAESGLNNLSVEKTIIADTCPPQPICPETKYRSVDGSCNNIRNKDWGQAGTAYQRIIIPDYSDGANAIRLSKSNSLLPSARAISQSLTNKREQSYDEFTLLIMQWGQFLDHDITHTPISKGENSADISCCSRGDVRPPEDLHPECFPIVIPANDTFYSNFGQRCMEFVRSLPAIRRECKFGPREQMNQITAFIDASNVYGSTERVAKSLREERGGLLRFANVDGRPLLPGDEQALGCGPRRHLCFRAGDVRVNEQPHLIVMHTIWMRQHNRVAAGLAAVNPGWTDEVIYQETRRIIIAQMQHITYNEYLPIVLGQQFMVSFGLVPLSSGYSNTYLDTVDPSINNAFASSAFRYGHSLVAALIEKVSPFGTVDSIPLSESQFFPDVVYEKGNLDSLLRGLSIQRSEKFDNQITDQLTDRLFAGSRNFGMDLIALNIQRGRDHGLPAYNKWRKICHLPEARTFDDLADVMTIASVKQLEAQYEHVDDIDLFIGGLQEIPKAGSLLGHTFLCIVGDQFARLKRGDRLFYDNGGMPFSFSEAQLDQIRQTSMARIICDNSDEIQTMQPLAFVQASILNVRVSCSNGDVIPGTLNPEAWRNEPVWP